MTANLDLKLTYQETKALLALIAQEQTRLNGYGDPGTYAVSDLAFFNVLEAKLIEAVTVARNNLGALNE